MTELQAMAQEIRAMRESLARPGLTVSVNQAGLMLGCGRRTVFYLLSEGKLERAPRYGREIRIYTASVIRAQTPRGKVQRQRQQVGPEPVDLSRVRI